MVKVHSSKATVTKATSTKATAVKASMPCPKPETTKGKTLAVKATKTKRLSPDKIVSRNEKIQKMYSTGKYSVRSLAEKVGLSKTRVGEIII